MQDALTVTFGNEANSLELQFTSSEERVCDTVVRIRQGAFDLGYSSHCFGYDLAEFARELELLHATYEGVARFINQVGSIEVELAIAHPARGVVGVTAKLEHWVSWPADYAPFCQQAEQSPLEFRGFTIEQSYLPSVISQIREFLAQSGVSTIHPMIHDSPA